MRIDVLGTSFNIETDEDPEHVADIVDYFKTKVQEIRSSVRTSDPLKIGILAGLLAVDELFKERESSNGEAMKPDEAQRAAEIAEQLIAELDKTLADKSDGEPFPDDEQYTEGPDEHDT